MRFVCMLATLSCASLCLMTPSMFLLACTVISAAFTSGVVLMTDASEDDDQ